MRFGLVHRWMTDALAVLGILAIVSTASLSTASNVALVLAVCVAIAVPESVQSQPWHRSLATFGPLLVFGIEVLRFALGQTALDVAVEFAASLQVLRLATRKGAAHDQQIIVLALLHLIAGTVLGGSITYGICFLGFLVVAPGALVLSHLRREVEGNYRQGARDRTGLPVDVPRILRSRRVVGTGFLLSTCLLSIPILLFTVSLFLLFPRVGLSLLVLSRPRQGRMVGFSDHVDLGQVGVLRSDPTIALRITVPHLPDPPPPLLAMYLRGTALDTYDGHAWSRSITDRKPLDRSGAGAEIYPLVREPDPQRDRLVSIELEPIEPPVVFLPSRPVALRVRPRGQVLLSESFSLQRGPESEYRYSPPDSRGLGYDVFLAADNEVLVEGLPAPDRGRYLAIPPNVSPRVAELARKWTQGAQSDVDKAQAILSHLRREYAYDLNSPSGANPHPLEHFLFESKRGHCEFYSSAMAILLRSIGIPTRNVTGFVGGVYNRFGRYYAVREGDAHSWVEAYIDDPKHPHWQSFDPTPPAGSQPLAKPNTFLVYVRDVFEALTQRWNRYVLGYDLRTQIRLLESLSRSYSDLKSRAIGTDDPKSRSQNPLVVLSALAALAATYWAWRRFRSSPHIAHRLPRPNAPSSSNTAAQLYALLDATLAAQGLSRPSSLPPLRHAEDLARRHHPLAPEVLALTKIYLDARFGGAPLAHETRRDFERRVNALRPARGLPPPTSSEPPVQTPSTSEGP